MAPLRRRRRRFRRVSCKQSDYVFVHCPLLPTTHHLINERALRLMKPTAVLINTSRGPVVDEPALIRALTEKWISAAGLDVFEQEPIDPATRSSSSTTSSSRRTSPDIPTCSGIISGGTRSRPRSTWQKGRWPRSYVNRDVKPRWSNLRRRHTVARWSCRPQLHRSAHRAEAESSDGGGGHERSCRLFLSDGFSRAEDLLTEVIEAEDAPHPVARPNWQSFVGRLLVSRDIVILIVAVRDVRILRADEPQVPWREQSDRHPEDGSADRDDRGRPDAPLHLRRNRSVGRRQLRAQHDRSSARWSSRATSTPGKPRSS